MNKIITKFTHRLCLFIAGILPAWGITETCVAQTSKNWTSVQALHQKSDAYPLEPVNHFFFINKNVGWAVGPRGSIQKTTNGGRHWSKCNSLESANLENAFFLDALHGWVWAANGPLLYTQSGGNHWRKLLPPETLNIRDVYFTDVQTGFMTCTEGVFKTNNSGNSWEPMYPFSDNGFSKIQFTDKNHGFIFHFWGLLRTEDAGKTWDFDSIKTQKGSSLGKGHFLDKNRGIIAGNYPEVLLITENGGRTWKEIPGMSPKSDLLNHEEEEPEIQSILFLSDSEILSLNNLNELLQSSNHGKTWQKINFPYRDIWVSDVQFFNPKEGILYNFSHREFFSTSDGGKTWSSLKDPKQNHLNDIFFVNKNYGYAVGDRGTVLKTTNAGKSWELLGFDAETQLQRVFFLNQHTGWVTGDRADIYVTRDGGASWSGQVLPLNIFTDATKSQQISSEQILRCAHSTFSDPCAAKCIQHTLEHVHMFSANEGWIQGRVKSCDIASYTTLYITKDGGKNWSPINIPVSRGFIDFEFLDALNGYAIDKNRVYKTTDGGISWIWFKTPSVCNSGNFSRLYRANDTMLCVTAANRTVIAVPFISSKALATSTSPDTKLNTLKKNQAKFFLEKPNHTVFERCSWDRALLVSKNYVSSSNGSCFGKVTKASGNPLSQPVSSIYCTDRKTIYLTGKNGFIGKIENVQANDTKTTTQASKKTQNPMKEIKQNIIIDRNGIRIFTEQKAQ